VNLQTYQERFARLLVNVRQGRASPHKVCMLLAALDLARSGSLIDNRIGYGPALLERYGQLFAAVRTSGDHPNPYFPFFHLAGRLRGGIESFWHLQPLPGRETALGTLRTARSHADIVDNVAWAWLDPALFDLLQQPEAVESLAETLSNRWFDRGLQDLQAVAGRQGTVSRYERLLREIGPLPSNAPKVCEPVAPAVRSAAFRRVVLQAYDYRCAASGLRMVLDNTEALVEAAHIRPFFDSADDDPRNGLALTPNMHWAMDRNLIAPGPDYCWHVSRALDRRIPDFRPLLELDGQPLLPPQWPRLLPRQDVLAWRLDRLRDPAWSSKDSRASADNSAR